MVDYITQQITLYPQIEKDLIEIQNYFENKLWHQLSLKLESLLRTQPVFKGQAAYELYSNFISQFDSRINQLKFTTIIALLGHELQDVSLETSLYDEILTKSNWLGEEAKFCLEMDIVIRHLKESDLLSAKNRLNKFEDYVKKENISDAVVFSKYYKALMEYQKLSGFSNEFFASAILYLGYTNLEDLSQEEKISVAKDMITSGLIGDNIYSYGGILDSPIVEVLSTTIYASYVQLLETVQQGNTPQFHALLASPAIQSLSPEYNTLVTHASVLELKITLMGMMNIFIERSAHDRIVQFPIIQEKCCVAEDKVEWLLMKAMSVGLMKGTIDEVDQTISVSWINPRMVEKRQYGVLRDQIAAWQTKVKDALHIVEERATELYV